MPLLTRTLCLRGILGLSLLAAPSLSGTLSALARQAPESRYSRRLGIFYQLVSYGGSYGAQLTAPPVPGSPLSQAQAQLEQGDTITHIDNAPLTSVEQLEQHHSQTAIAFVNVRTGGAEARWVYLPPQNDPGVPPTSAGYMSTGYTSNYSPRFGIYYDLVRYGGGLGVKLRMAPVPGSPLRQAQAQLEKGDMITHLDNAPITTVAQLEQHHSQTAVSFVNVRSGAAEARWVFLPIQGAPGVPPSWSASAHVLPPIAQLPPPPPELIVPEALK